MRKLFGAVLGLTITVLGFVSFNDVRAQDPKLPPLDRTLRPDQTAVIMVDFQNNFASPQGAFYSPFEKQFRDTHMIENSLNLVKVARELGILVIHVTEGYTDDYREVDLGNGGSFIATQYFGKPLSPEARVRNFMRPFEAKRTLSFPIAKPCQRSVETRLTTF
jgi:hypothetical protein